MLLSISTIDWFTIHALSWIDYLNKTTLTVPLINPYSAIFISLPSKPNDFTYFMDIASIFLKCIVLYLYIRHKFLSSFIWELEKVKIKTTPSKSIFSWLWWGYYFFIYCANLALVYTTLLPIKSLLYGDLNTLKSDNILGFLEITLIALICI